jgi:hypothetical protein
MAKKVGIDIYDNKHDKLCREYIKAAVDGDDVFKGFGGDYEAYLAALKKMNLNYSVQELFIRYEIARGEINEYYAGDAATGGLDKGHVSYTDEDILSFYESDEESRRVYNVYLPSDAFTEARAKEIRDTMASMSGDDSVAWYIMNFSTATDVGDLAELVGRYSSDTFYFGEVTDAAFTLSEGECSEPILTRTDELDGYTIVYRCEKTDEFFEIYEEYVRAVYVQNEIGRIFEKTARGLYESAVYSKNYNSIVHSEIGMDE